MIKQIALLLTLAIFVSACHHRVKTRLEEPESYGKNQYVIYYESKKKSSKVKAQVVKKANSYCQKNNAKMVPQSDSEVERYHYQFIFSCQKTTSKSSKTGGPTQTDKSDDSGEPDEDE